MVAHCAQRIALSATGDFALDVVDVYNTGTGYSPVTNSNGLRVDVDSPPDALYRYVRFWSSGSDNNAGVHILEVAIKGYAPVALIDVPVATQGFWAIDSAGAGAISKTLAVLACNAFGCSTESISGSTAVPCSGTAANTVQDGLCWACPPGQFSAPSNMTTCTLMTTATCPPGEGFYSASSVKADAGYFFGATEDDGMCSVCPKGRWKPTEKASVCNICEVGKFQNITGSDFPCQVCQAGFFQNDTGSAGCASCAIGRFSALAGGADGLRAIFAVPEPLPAAPAPRPARSALRGHISWAMQVWTRRTTI